jgi:UDP-N-acetylglucosamine 2-epimerase (non-hydrolysing)
MAIDLIAGARPNFIKIAPVVRALEGRLAAGSSAQLSWRIVHTGQHYDFNLDGVFFEQLSIPRPDVHLDVGSGRHGSQTARILERYEAHALKAHPEAAVVFGDVNSTVACALAASKLEIPVVHVEAGLRSFDRSMPEEINRIVTDCLSDLLFVSEQSGLENLKREGIDDRKVHFVGNVMIDTLVRELSKARELRAYEKYGLESRSYGLITLHRPSNVDDEQTLSGLLMLFAELGGELPLVFPVHPRTRKAIDEIGCSSLLSKSGDLLGLKPLSYAETLSLLSEARLVMTDSGGVQEEASFLHIPCLTIRNNTERPVTLTKGTNRLVGNDHARIRSAFYEALSGKWPLGDDIPLWDGHAAERIVAILLQSWPLKAKMSVHSR